MAIINIVSGDSISEALGDAAAGDEIVAAAGTYGPFSLSSYTRTSAVTLRAADTKNRPVIQNSASSEICVNFTSVNGLTIDGFIFKNSTATSDSGYPRAGDIGLRVGTASTISAQNLTLRNCTFDSWQRGIELNRGANVVVEYCEFVRTGMDNFRVYARVDGLRFSWCLFHKPKIDKTRYHENVFPSGGSERHPDNLQFAVPVGNTGSQGSRNVTIEFSWFETWDDYQHNILILNERWLKTTGGNIRDNEFQNVKVTNCRMIAGHTHALAISAGNYDIDRVWISPFPPNNFERITGEGSSTNHEPTISVFSGVSGSIKNCSLTRDIWPAKGTGVNAKTPTLDNITQSGNVVLKANENLKPTGWVELEGKVGPYGGGGTKDTKPGALESTLVTMSGTPYDAGQVEFADGTFQAYSGTIVVQSTSKAWDTNPAKSEFQWRSVDENVNGWKPMRVATPSKNAANSTRYEMRSDYETAKAATDAGFPGAHRVHARRAGAVTMTDITLRWRPAGTKTWSDESTFSLQFTTPAAAATLPSVSAVTLTNSAYSIGQTATATLVYSIGSGTFTSLRVDWMLGSTIVETDTLTNGATTASYTTTAAGSLTARATLVTSAGTSTLTSTAASVTAAAVAPDVTAVTLSKATYAIGEVATATPTYTAGNGTGLALTYQWRRNGANISGATAATYTTVAADVGTGTLACVVTATTSAGSDSMVSAASSVASAQVAPVVSSVALNKTSYSVGETATATPTYTAGNGTGLAITYQWRRSGAAISGATASTYAIVAADVGASTLSCSVTATTSAGTSTATSPASTVATGVSVPDMVSVALDNTAYVTGATATATLAYSNGGSASAEVLCRWMLSGATPAPKPWPALDPVMAGLASAAPDYRCAAYNSSNARIAEGTSTAYHGMVAELVGYEVQRGNVTHNARLATQLRRFLSAGGDPVATGGLATQYDVHPALCLLAAKLAPGGWWASEFTSAERTKFDLIFKGLAVGAAWSGSASANPSISLVGGENQPKNTPNWRTSIPATLWAWAAYLGGYGTPDFAGVLAEMTAFDKTAFYTSLTTAGLTNMADTMQSRSGSTGPTNAVVQTALDSWQFIARTGSTHWALSDVAGILKAELEFCFSNTIAAGLNNGDGVNVQGEMRGLIAAGADDLPNLGQVGMLHQFDTTDGGGTYSTINNRSAMSYSIRTYFNAADICLAAIMGGLIDPSTISGVVALADRCARGVRDLEYKHDQGYNSVAKGGSATYGNNNENWRKTGSMETAHRVPVQIAAWRDIIDPWLRSSSQFAATRPTGTTSSVSLPAAKSGTLTVNAEIRNEKGADSVTSGSATVGAPATAPTVGTPVLNGSTYAVGQTATAAFTANLGNGTFTSLVVEWRLDGVLIETDTLGSAVRSADFVIPSVGSLTARVVATTSAGAANATSAAATVTLPAPAALTEAQWEFAGVISAPGLVDRFTGEIRMLVADAAVTGMDWTADGATWRPCIGQGVDAQGRKLWQMGPSTTAGDAAHTVGYDENSALIRVRYATAGGTSAISTGTGKRFKGLAQPPIEEPELPAPAPSDWVLTPVAVEHTGKFLGRITLQGVIVPESVVTMQWTNADGIWRPLTKVVGAIWEMRPLEGEPEAHLVVYGSEDTSIRIRYTTADQTSGISATKTLAAPPVPPSYAPGQITGNGTIAGTVMRTAGLVIPGTPSGEINAKIAADDAGIFEFVAPALPVGGTHLYLIYANQSLIITPGALCRVARVAGQGIALIVAVDAAGTAGRQRGAESIARYFPVP